jgi:hypothetical protein
VVFTYAGLENGCDYRTLIEEVALLPLNDYIEDRLPRTWAKVDKWLYGGSSEYIDWDVGEDAGAADVHFVFWRSRKDIASSQKMGVPFYRGIDWTAPPQVITLQRI